MAELDEMLVTAEQRASRHVDTYTYSDDYLHLEEYISDNDPVRITSKYISSIANEPSIVGENNSQYIEFMTDRYQDGIDLTEMIFHISWTKNDIGDEVRPINFRYDDDTIIFGWLIDSSITQYEGSITFGFWAQGTKYDNEYIWKTIPSTYTTTPGVLIAGNVPEPDENWYTQFTSLMDSKVAYVDEQMTKIDDAEQAAKDANEAADKANTAAMNANTAATTANTATSDAQSATKSSIAATKNTNQAITNANTATSNATTAAERAEAAAVACEGIVAGLNTMVDTVTGVSCVLSLEDGILTVREA